MQPNAAGRDLWGHWFESANYPDSFLSTNVFFNDVVISPAYYVLSLILYVTTGATYQAFPRNFLETLLPLVLVVGSLFMGSQLFATIKHQVLFVLCIEAFMWVPTNTLPSPELAGFLLTLFMIGICFAGLRGRRLMIFWIGFVALVITHILFSFIFLGYLFVLYAVDKLGLSGAGARRISFRTLLGSMLVYISYYALIPLLLREAIPVVISAFSNPQGGTPIYVPLTPYQEPTITMSWIFIGIVGLWFIGMITIEKLKPFKSGKFITLLALMIPLIGIPFTGAYSQQGLLQIFFVGSPLLAAALVTVSQHRVALMVVLVLILLPFSLVLRYSNHYIEPIPQSEFAGDRYLANFNTQAAQVFWPVSGGTGQYANSVLLDKELVGINYAEGGIRMTSPVSVVVMTSTGDKILRWYEGDSVFHNIMDQLANSKGNVIYNSVGFTVSIFYTPISLNYT